MSQITAEARAKAEIYHGDEICHEKIQQLLSEINLPDGILPLKDIEECGRIKDTGFVWLKQKKSIVHKFEKIGKLVSYEKEISAYIEKNRMWKIAGVKVKEFLIWISIGDMSVDDPSTGKIHFKTPAGLSRSYPVSAFQIKAPEGKKDEEILKNQIKEV